MLCQSFPNSAGVNCCITLAPRFNQSAYTERKKGRRWKAGLSSERNYNLFQFRQVMTLQGVFTFVDQYLISWIILKETKEGDTMLTRQLVMVLEANSIWLIDYIGSSKQRNRMLYSNSLLTLKCTVTSQGSSYPLPCISYKTPIG